jgi:hypothetical protein
MPLRLLAVDYRGRFVDRLAISAQRRKVTLITLISSFEYFNLLGYIVVSTDLIR